MKRIEVISPGLNDSYISAYVEGADNILGIAEGRINVLGVMVAKVGEILSE